MNAAYIKYFYRAGVIDDIGTVLEDCILTYYATSYQELVVYFDELNYD